MIAAIFRFIFYFWPFLFDMFFGKDATIASAWKRNPKLVVLIGLLTFTSTLSFTLGWLLFTVTTDKVKVEKKLREVETLCIKASSPVPSPVIEETKPTNRLEILKRELRKIESVKEETK